LPAEVVYLIAKVISLLPELAKAPTKPEFPSASCSEIRFLAFS
jgi:hypothetical protein